jgi:predicted metal-dependent hydrolase
MKTAIKKQKIKSWHNPDELKWCVRAWASKMSVAVPFIHLRHMRSKWASISTHGRLTLNLELLELPRELGEYVIVHELVHLLAPNHGKVFKSFMGAYMPGWEQLDQDIRVWAPHRLANAV